jgi:hypothetical protein
MISHKVIGLEFTVNNSKALSTLCMTTWLQFETSWSGHCDIRSTITGFIKKSWWSHAYERMYRLLKAKDSSKYIYIWQVYTCYRNTVFYFDTSHSLSSQHVSAPRAIIKWVTNIKFLYFKKTSYSTDPLFLSFTKNYYNFVLASYILK